MAATTRKEISYSSGSPEIFIYHLERQLHQAISTLLTLGGYRHYTLSTDRKFSQKWVDPIPILITSMNSDKSQLPPYRRLITVSHIREGIGKALPTNHFIIPLQNENLLLTIDNLLYQKMGDVIQISSLQGGAGSSTIAFCLAKLLHEYLQTLPSALPNPNRNLRIAVVTSDRFSPWLGKMGGVQLKLSDEIAKSSDWVLSRKIESLANYYSGISHFSYSATTSNSILAFIDSLRKTHCLILVDLNKAKLPVVKLQIRVGKPERQSYQKLQELPQDGTLLVWNNPLRIPKHWILPPGINTARSERSFLIPHCKQLFYASQQNLDIPIPKVIKRSLRNLKKEIINECFGT